MINPIPLTINNPMYYMLSTVNNTSAASIFSFASYISALALLILVFVISDIRYKFRIAIAPISLSILTFIILVFTGLCSLLIDLWQAKQWYLPSFLDLTILQSFFGALFLITALTWIFFAFICPPTFGSSNAKKYIETLLKIIAKGSNEELPIIAEELGRSAQAIVKYSATTHDQKKLSKSNKMTTNKYAYDLIILIRNRNLCRHLISSAPGTVVELFREMSKLKKNDIPIGEFSQLCVAEAIKNKDSLLYHEDDGYNSGIIGVIKPLTNALFGNYDLVSTLEFTSPLDIDYKIMKNWDADQWEAYTRCVLITADAYLKKNLWPTPSPVLSRAINTIKESVYDLGKLNKLELNHLPDIINQLNVVINFFLKIIKLIEEHNIISKNWDKNLLNTLALAIYDVISYSSQIQSPPQTCWSIQYVAIWDKFFGCENTPILNVVRFKITRLLYNDIKKIMKFPNFKDSKILGFCLNIFGLKIHPSYSTLAEQWLHKRVLMWTCKNYLNLRTKNKNVADNCLCGCITFYEKGNTLIRTGFNELNPELNKQKLVLPNRTKK